METGTTVADGFEVARQTENKNWRGSEALLALYINPTPQFQYKFVNPVEKA
jgi:hypothetical protein